jgi:hypothetical protein
MNKEQIKDLIKCLEANNESINLLAGYSEMDIEIEELQIKMNNMQIAQLQMMLQLEK